MIISRGEPVPHLDLDELIDKIACLIPVDVRASIEEDRRPGPGGVDTENGLQVGCKGRRS